MWLNPMALKKGNGLSTHDDGSKERKLLPMSRTTGGCFFVGNATLMGELVTVLNIDSPASREVRWQDTARPMQPADKARRV